MFASGTERGNEVMAHVAALLDLPLATNVTEVRPGDESWEVTRTRWGGSLLEEASLTAPVKLATVAPHVFEASDASGSVDAETFKPELPEALERTRVVERVTISEGITLTTAPVVVSGGRGVGSPEGFGILEELAALLGGAVGCSRVVTNNGWRPHSDQVGQTGTRVAPNLYVACGISGAIQHWVGMMASKNVLAINNDPEAPMVTKADYAVIGDLHPILEAVVAEVRRRKGSDSGSAWVWDGLDLLDGGFDVDARWAFRPAVVVWGRDRFLVSVRRRVGFRWDGRSRDDRGFLRFASLLRGSGCGDAGRGGPDCRGWWVHLLTRG